MLKSGDRKSFEKRLRVDVIDAFADITEDFNSLHTNTADPSVWHVQQKLGVSDLIAHGPLVFSLACKPLCELGGSGTVVCEFGRLRFLKPVEVGELVRVTCTVDAEVKPSNFKITITFRNEVGEDVIAPTYAIILVLFPEENPAQ